MSYTESLYAYKTTLENKPVIYIIDSKKNEICRWYLLQLIFSFSNPISLSYLSFYPEHYFYYF